MDNKLQSLIDLEKIDIEIARLENSKEEYPRKVEEMESELAEKKDALSAIERSITEQETGLANSEQSVLDSQEALERSHVRLNDVTTNKEYDAVLLEINERKEMIERARKKKVRFSEKLKSLTEEISAVREEYDAIYNEKQPIIDDLKSKIASIDDDVKRVAESRENLLKEVPANYLSMYTTISAKRKSGRVLAPITADSPACSYCFQILTPNVHKRVQSADRPVTCENCGSIFVWGGSTPENTESE